MYGLKNVRNRRHDALSRVDPGDFESLLATHYRQQGYQVEHCGTGGTRAIFDGGIDLKLRRDDQYILVQCKHWNAKQVPHNDVHQLLGIMVNEGATGAILITSGEFTKAAIEAATRQGRVQLIDGEELRVMLGPIPETDVPSSYDLRSAAGSIASHAADRLLAAAEDRIRGGRRTVTSRGVASTAGTLFIAKVLIPLLFAAIVLLAGLYFVRHLVAGLAPVTQSAPHAQPLPVPTAMSSQPVTPMSIVTSDGQSASDACHEVIDWQSGTYIDHCAKVSPPKPLSAAEQRERQRKAEEAMRIIKESTPEM
jgi:restriction system protein